MKKTFQCTGPKTELTSYPQWMQDVVTDCAAAKRVVVRHEMWDKMSGGELDLDATTNFMVGIWPVIERFPAYMAMSLVKTRYGRSTGEDLARNWLARNIRVEQNHAEYWLKWAEGAGITRSHVLHGKAPAGAGTLATWCEEISDKGGLAASIAAVNYAVEGVTGEWSQTVYESSVYVEGFPPSTRPGALRWLQLHAAYDDVHPWEALEIVATLLGAEPDSQDVKHISDCIKRSYNSMRISLDRCMTTRSRGNVVRGAAA